MKSKLNLLLAGIFLASKYAVLGQSTVQFVANNYTVAESAGAITLTVQRFNDSNSAVSVDYATADGTRRMD